MLRLEEGIAGLATIPIVSAATTLTATNYSADQARNACLVFTGTLTANSTVTVPNVEKLYLAVNLTGGAFSLTLKTAAGSGVALRSGPQWVRCDGADVYLATPRLDQSPLPTAPVEMNGQRLTGLGTPSAATDAVPKSYSDAIAGSATAAATSAASAATSATSAAGSASSAATSATQAASSASSAATSAASASSRLPLSGGTISGELNVTGTHTAANLAVTSAAFIKYLNVGPDSDSEGGQINLVGAPGQTGLSIDTVSNGMLRVHTLPAGKSVQIIQADGSSIELRPDEFSAFPQIRLKGDSFKYLECESAHLAFVKAYGQKYYWRRNSTGRFGGAGEVELMSLDDNGGLSVLGPIYAQNGQTVWHTGNFDPATKQAAGSYQPAGNYQAALGYTPLPDTCYGVALAHAGSLGVQVLGSGGGASAITFHRPGSYAVNFGLETDNSLRIGGYSLGQGVSYRIWHEGVFDPFAANGVGAYALASYGNGATPLVGDQYGGGARSLSSGHVINSGGIGHVGGTWIVRSAPGDTGSLYLMQRIS